MSNSYTYMGAIWLPKFIVTFNPADNHKLIVHEGVKQPIMCPKCPMGFARKGNLINHLKYVHVEAKYECEHCNAKFKTKVSLTQHILSMHTDEKPFKCSECEMSFKTNGVKKAHLKRIHGIGDDPVIKKRKTEDYRSFERTCPHCNESLKNLYYLHKHIKAVHWKLLSKSTWYFFKFWT